MHFGPFLFIFALFSHFLVKNNKKFYFLKMDLAEWMGLDGPGGMDHAPGGGGWYNNTTGGMNPKFDSATGGMAPKSIPLHSAMAESNPKKCWHMLLRIAVNEKICAVTNTEDQLRPPPLNLYNIVQLLTHLI